MAPLITPAPNSHRTHLHRYQHKQFVNAQFCCNQDAAVFGHTCRDADADMYYAAPPGGYAPRQPHCPPLVTFTCASLGSPECQQVS